MDKTKPTASDYATGLIRQEDRHQRFWNAYIKASANDTWTNAMLDRAQVLAAKSNAGLRLFTEATNQ